MPVGGADGEARGRSGPAADAGAGGAGGRNRPGALGAAHDDVDGVTRVLLRCAYAGLDGRPAVLEERVFETFPAQDPAWEALFTEAMSRARFRCAYLNAEESS